MDIKDFSEIEAEFIRRVHSAVWCAAATVDRKGRPRSRILHPMWEGSTGWVTTNPFSHKSKHLDHNPHMSLAYVQDITKPVYVDVTAEWVTDPAEKQRIWNLFKNTPEPLGYDPTDTFGLAHAETFGVLKLTPWRIALITFPASSHDEGEKVWRNER